MAVGKGDGETVGGVVVGELVGSELEELVGSGLWDACGLAAGSLGVLTGAEAPGCAAELAVGDELAAWVP